MRKFIVIASIVGCAILAQANTGAPWIVERNNIVERTEAGCPSFPGVMYGSLLYNLGCIPWDLEFYDGAEVAATYTWYRYPQGGSQASATPCDWQTDFSTYRGFKPATDEMGTYIYFCQATASGCSTVKSGEFTVQIGANGDPCYNIQGKTFSVTQGTGSYVSGQEIVIQANNNADGGMHQYTWYHNGVEIDLTDPHYTVCADDEQCWHNPNLTIHNATPDDGGTYSVMMQDGTECFMYTDPIRILVDNPSCGPVPTLGVQKNAICEGESTQTGVSNNTLAAGEVGQIVYMVKPDGSNPSTTVGTWTTDMPGLYQFKYVVENPGNASCYRESKVATIRVYENGGTLTITPSVAVEKTTNKVNFTVSPAPGTDETATVTFTSDAGATGSVYPNTYPNFAHTCYNSGTYTYTYTITNSKAGCSRTATCEVLWYSCGWVTARFNNWVADKIKVGNSINLGPAVPTETGMIGILTVSKDGGTPEVIPTSSPYTPTDPGTYVFHYEVKHSDPRVTDCYSEVSKTIVVESCGTKATLATDKNVLKLGQSAVLTLATKASGETATLTYSKDGGANNQLPITNNQSSVTFTPTEVGTYVLTYSIKPSGCDATTAQVTINVYDCGPEATISADRTSIQPGGTITLNLSAPGADETATLTYSVNGGAAQTINYQQSPVTFTPTEEGIYVFTYAITHAYINCSRSAQVTVRAYNCGTPAGMAADKAVLKLGESATLTLNRQPVAADGETATLTYSKDGGAAQTIDYQLSTVNFTPSETGTYVLTYSIDNATLGCATSAQVTIRVYDCGPEATISVDQMEVRLGQSLSVTLSALGADETATLTVSKDGGTPYPVTGNPSPLTFTPDAVGEYTLTYTVTHPYIDCARSASVSFEVYDCGTPAAITTDKSAIRIGESAQLALSAVLPVETATLTYSKDGGTPQTINYQQSPVTFTPTETGVYVLTYTVSHTKIDCSTSAQVTIRVYDCGPDAAITLSATEQKIMRPVAITLSALGADETGTLTVSKDGGTPSPVTGNPSPITFTPTELGTYTFTYTITHPYIDCARSATVTLLVIEAELVFDDHNGTHIWSDPKNWWPAYNRIPNAADSAVIRKACQVDVENAVTYDLTFDGAQMNITPRGALVVVHRIMQAQQASITVSADATGNGALVLGQENTDIPATALFYARSADKDALYPVWQYMGYPMQKEALVSNAYPQAILYEWTNMPNRQVGGNWQRIDSLTGSVSPFKGYCMTQEQPHTYPLQGVLNNPTSKEIALPRNDQGAYPDFVFVANSWMAPIDLTALQTTDFGAADATVYIMNAGTYEEAIQQQHNASGMGTATARGQYNTIPVNAAPYMSGALTVIPPMQGFFVHTTQPTTLRLDYNKVVFQPALTKVQTTPTRAPENHKSENLSANNRLSEAEKEIINNKSVETVLRLMVSGYGAEDEAYILTGDDFAPTFDNGWDGFKARSEKSSISLAVQSVDGPLAVAALPELEGTEIAFDGGNHKTYTITAEISNVQSPISNDLYLLDTETGEYTELTEGATYSFKCGADTRRFRIVSLNGDEDEQKVNAEKFIQNGILYIRQGNRLYNGTGKLLYIEKDR